MKTALAFTLLAASGAACLADEVIVTTRSGLIHSIDLDSGSVAPLGVCTAPVRSMAVANGTLYLGGEDGFVYVFDLATEQITRWFDVPGDNNAMAWDGRNLMIANTDSSIILVDPADGAVLETRHVPTSDISAIGIDAGGLFVGGQNSIALRSHIGNANFSFFAACGSMINAMAFGPDTMYLGGTAFSNAQVGRVYKFDKFVGGVNYSGTFDVPNNASALLAYAGVLYVGGSDGRVLEMNPDDGQTLRTFVIGGEVTGVAPATGLISCPADYDVSGNLNFFDVARFLDLLAGRMPAGDTNGDGLYDFFDVQTFIDLYSGGCP